MENVILALYATASVITLAVAGITIVVALNMNKQHHAPHVTDDDAPNPYRESPDRDRFCTLIKTTTGNPVSSKNPASRCMFSPFDIESARESTAQWANDNGVTMDRPMLDITFTSGRTLQVNMSEAELEERLLRLEAAVEQYTMG